MLTSSKLFITAKPLRGETEENNYIKRRILVIPLHTDQRATMSSLLKILLYLCNQSKYPDDYESSVYNLNEYIYFT